MQGDDVSRRSVLQGIAGALGGAALPIGWTEIARAAHAAHAAAQSPSTATFSFFDAADAADVGAICAQIIPSDATPGAREAGTVYFIDRGLGSFFNRFADEIRSGLKEFQAACRTHCPDAPSFAALPSERQIEFLKTVENGAFFDRVRMLTLCGMFSLPMYGGNRDGVGWKLIGFEDQHVFQPPFGHYDRDYAGFVIEPVKPR